MQLYVFPWNF